MLNGTISSIRFINSFEKKSSKELLVVFLLNPINDLLTYALLVIIINTLSNLTVLPLESLQFPSSSIFKKKLRTDLCAFSISSNIRTEYGLFLISSSIFLLSSYPTYPAGEPIILFILMLSEYSLISSFITLFLPTKFSANSLDKYVLPVPVDPQNRTE